MTEPDGWTVELEDDELPGPSEAARISFRDQRYAEAIVMMLTSSELEAYVKGRSDRTDRLRALAVERQGDVHLHTQREQDACWRSLDEFQAISHQLNRYRFLVLASVLTALAVSSVGLVLLLQARLLAGLFVLVSIGLTAVAAASFGGRGRLDSWWKAWGSREEDRRSAEQDIRDKRRNWQTALLEALMPYVREAIARDKEFAPTMWTDHLRRDGIRPNGLRQPFDSKFHIMTETGHRLARLFRDLDGGSLALAGARGTGKSDLIEAFVSGYYHENGVYPRVAVVMSAPTEYAPRDFVLQLFAEACEATRRFVSRPESGSLSKSPRRLDESARERLAEIRYLQSMSSEVGGTVTVPFASTGLKEARNLTQQALTYPEIVRKFRTFLEDLAANLVGIGDNQVAVPVLIAIDELDRMGSAENARTFLNEVKGIFNVRGCRFVVSVSDETLETFELAGFPLDLVVDRAFDEVVHMGYLDLDAVSRLLVRRVTPPFPEPFVALCYCMSGGIARDAIRAARAVAGIGRDTNSRRPDETKPENQLHYDTLSDVTVELVIEEAKTALRWARNRLIRCGVEPAATDWLRRLEWWEALPSDPRGVQDRLLRITAWSPPADQSNEVGVVCNRLHTLVYYLVTLLDVFTSNAGLQRRLIDSVVLERFARSRRALRLNDRLARTLLQEVRKCWKLPELVQPPVSDGPFVHVDVH